MYVRARVCVGACVLVLVLVLPVVDRFAEDPEEDQPELPDSPRHRGPGWPPDHGEDPGLPRGGAQGPGR